MDIFTLSFNKILLKKLAISFSAVFLFLLYSFSSFSQSVTLNDANTGITAGSISFGQKDIPLFGFSLRPSEAMEITGINIRSSADASRYFSNGKLYRSSDNEFSNDDVQVSASISWGTTVGITGLSENLDSQTYYYFLTADYTETSGSAGTIAFSFSSTQTNAVIETRVFYIWGFEIPYTVDHDGANISGKTFNIPAPPATIVWDGSQNTKWNDYRNWVGNKVPGASDIAYIGTQSFTNQPTVTEDEAIGSIVFGTAKSVILTVNSNKTLTVNGDITQSSANSNESSQITGSGRIIVNSINVGSSISASGWSDQTYTTVLASTIGNLIVKDNILMQSGSASSRIATITNNASFQLSSGKVTVGTIKTVNTSSSNTSTFTLNTGSKTGTLNLTALNPISLSSTGTSTIDFRGGANSYVNYNGTSAQNVAVGTGIIYGDKIKVNNPAGVSLNSALTIKNLVIGDETPNSIFNEKGYSTISTSLTIKNNSKLIYGGTAFSFRAADVIDAGTTVEFNRSGAQNITLGNKTLQNVILSGSGTKTITAALDNTPFKTEGSLTISSPAVIAYSNKINVIDIDGDFNGTGSINSGSLPINIAGNWNNTASGTIAGLVTYDGTNQSVGGMNYSSLVFANGGTKKITNNASVTGDIEVKANTTLDADGKLTLKASATATANIKPLLNGAKVIGTATIQAYFKGGSRGYLTLSSPVSDTGSAFTFSQLQKSMIVTGKGGPANGFDIGSSINPYGPTVQLYNESAAPSKSQYSYLTSINENIDAGKGFYFYFRGDRTNPSKKVNTPYDTPENVTMEYTGSINQGIISVPLSYTDHSGAADNGFNMVGNPYPSIIDLNVLLGSQENKSWILKKDNSYAVYDSQLGQGINGASRYILPGQGFFIKTSQPGAVLTFTENCKVSPGTVPGRIMKEKNKFLMASEGTKTYSSPIQFIKLAVKQDSSLSDETIIALKEGSDSTMTAEDANYLGAGKISISSLSSDDKKLAINYMPLVEGEDREVKLNVTASESGSYSIETSDITAFEGMDIFLNDLYTKQTISLKSGRPYTFSIDKEKVETYGKERFKISFMQPKIFPLSQISFTAKKVSIGAELNWLITSNTDNTRFEIQRSTDGRTFTSIDTISEARMFYSYRDINPVAGVNYYRLKQVGADGRTTYYEPAALTFDLAKKTNPLALTVYPNPVVNELHIALGEKTGPVGIRIYDTSGKTIKSEEVHSSESIVQNVAGLQTGIYIVEVTGTQSNELLGKAKFIKQ